MGKFCVQCGAELEEGAFFCTKCGTSVEMQGNDSGKVPDKEAADGEGRNKEKSGKKRAVTILVIAAAVVLLAAGIGSAVYLLGDEYQCRRNMRLAAKNYEAENYEEAGSCYEAALELDDTLTEAYLGLADIYAREKSYEKALKLLKRGAKKSEDGEEKEILNEKYQEVCLEGADFFSDNGEYDQAIRLLAEGREQLDDDRALMDKIAKVYLKEADAFVQEKDYEQAIAVLKEGQETVGDDDAARLSDKEREIRNYLIPPAEQVVAALAELYIKDNAVPMQELLGFTSKEDVYQAFYEMGGNMELANQLRMELVDLDVFFSDEEIEELSGDFLEFLSKVEYAAELTYESEDEMVVTLKVYGFSFAQMNQLMEDATDRMYDSITDEDLRALAGGDTDVLSVYVWQFLMDVFEGLSELEIQTEPVEVYISCEKLSIQIDGREKSVWLPSDMEDFSYDLENAVYQY